MNKLLSVLCNVALYSFLVWLLYRNTIARWDPWFAFVIAFVLFLAVVISLIPGLHAPKVSPGEYPYED